MNIEFYDYDFVGSTKSLSINGMFLPPPSPSPSTASEIEPYKCNREVASWSDSVFNDSSKTDVTSRSSKKKVLDATLWKQRRLPREDLVSVATSLVAERFAVAAAVTPLIVAVNMSAVFPFRRVWYMTGLFYFGNAILILYFIVSSAVL